MATRELEPLWSRVWPAPAKLNLFLHVVGQRADGYHLLQSVFRLVDLCDEVVFTPREDGEVRRAEGPIGVPEADDLTVRAARALQAETDAAHGVTIAVRKRIPMGGGLGGGSSDAATTLAVLNRLWNLDLPPERLAAIGERLGADVPFFLGGANAFVEGIGERLTPIALPAAWYVIVVPPVAVSTREVFAAPELTRSTPPVKIQGFPAGYERNGLAGYGRNDLEPVVVRRYPEVMRAREWLEGHGAARMSGSGACVFAEFHTEREARAVASRVPAGMVGMAVRGLDRHPLAAMPGQPVTLGSRQAG